MISNLMARELRRRAQQPAVTFGIGVGVVGDAPRPFDAVRDQAGHRDARCADPRRFVV